MVKLLEQMFTKSRDFKHAARCAEKLGDKAGAGKLAALGGQHGDAAKLYAAAGQGNDAAKSWLKAGKPTEAAKAYQETGELILAAETHELGGDLLEAARTFAMSGDDAKALPLLERVEPSRPQYFEARKMLGSLQARLAMYHEAVRTFIGVLRGQPPPPPELATEMLYLLGHVYGKMNDTPRAKSAFEHVLQQAPGYRDVAQLLAALAARGQQSPPPPVPKAPANPNPNPPSGGHPVAKLEDFDRLKAMPLARDFSLDDLRLLHSQCETARFEPGGVMIKEGTVGEALFIVRAGQVSVKVGDNVVATLG